MFQTFEFVKGNREKEWSRELRENAPKSSGPRTFIGHLQIHISPQ